MENSQSHSELIKTDYGGDIAESKNKRVLRRYEGDMSMLSNAVAYYSDIPANVYSLVNSSFELPNILDFDHIVLPGKPIDFHPCSWILKKLTGKTALDNGSLELYNMVW